MSEMKQIKYADCVLRESRREGVVLLARIYIHRWAEREVEGRDSTFCPGP